MGLAVVGGRVGGRARLQRLGLWAVGFVLVEDRGGGGVLGRLWS